MTTNNVAAGERDVFRRLQYVLLGNSIAPMGLCVCWLLGNEPRTLSNLVRLTQVYFEMPGGPAHAMRLATVVLFVGAVYYSVRWVSLVAKRKRQASAQ